MEQKMLAYDIQIKMDVGYSYVDHVGIQLDRKSTSGTCQLLGNSLVSWFSKKKNCVHFLMQNLNM